MALRLIEGFDHTSDIALKSWVTSNSIGVSGVDASAIAAARIGSGHSFKIGVTTDLGLGAGSTVIRRYKIWNPSSTEVIIGWAMKPDSYFLHYVGAWVPSGVFFITSTGTEVAFLDLSSTRNPIICVPNGGEGTIVASSLTVANDLVWHYYEMRIKVNGASGECELYIDGGPAIATTVYNFGTTPISGVKLQLWGSGASGFDSYLHIDDMYALDATGAAPHNGFLGDCRVETIMPTGAGASTGWTPLSGSNYANVNEMTGTYPDGDTSYVTAEDAGDRDTYVTGNVSLSNALVYGVQTNLTARKDTAGYKTIAPVIRQGGVNYAGTTQTLSTSYQTKQQIWERDPTAALWTVSNVNADEFGMEVIT